MGRKPRKKTPAAIAFGRYLAGLRHAKELSIRDVSFRSDGVLSNAYLSQIENGWVRFPHPNILWTLAKIYHTDYHGLIRMIFPAGLEDENLGPNANNLMVIGLTSDEYSACLAFLASMRKAKIKLQ